MNKIPFIDLASQYGRIMQEVDGAIKAVLCHGMYVMGPEVYELEAKLSVFTGCKHSISCSNGTDAIVLALKAKNVKPGDAVFVPSFTFAATAEAVALVGATPVFVDILQTTLNIDVDSLKNALHTAKETGLNPVGIITVDIFGVPADYEQISKFAKAEGLFVIADCAQSFGAEYNGKKVCACDYCDIATTSFFPAKPLGCYGDGGAIFTNDDAIASEIISYRVHGQGTDKYQNDRIGLNARLDTIQAAILLKKLEIFQDEIVARNEIAGHYNKALCGIVEVQTVPANCLSVWAQYTIKFGSKTERDEAKDYLSAKEIPSVIYYPKPLHMQKAYLDYANKAKIQLSVSEFVSDVVLSLPMSPYLTEQHMQEIISAMQTFCSGKK